jgi:thioester reductase-like protein
VNEYFLTGATGVVGSAIADELLARPGNRLTLLVRAGSDAELASRLDALLAFWQRDPAATRERVRALRGDTTLPDFGLAPDAFEDASRRTTHIVHCAAAVRMTLPLAEARRSAQGAAENVVRLAQACARRGTLRKLELLSTVGVGGRWPHPLPERFITDPRAFHNTYEQSKAEAEDYLRQRIAGGLPATVHRPSMVVGDSRTGRTIAFQIFYHLTEFLAGTRTFGAFPPFGTTRLDIVPVDYVASAVAWSSEQEATVGRVMHLCSGPDRSLPLGELQRRVRARFAATGVKLPPIVRLPSVAFRLATPTIAAFAPARLKRALATLPIFLDYLAEDQAFENTATRTLLEDAGITLPRVDDYLPRVLDYYLAHRARPERTRERAASSA